MTEKTRKSNPNKETTDINTITESIKKPSEKWHVSQVQGSCTANKPVNQHLALVPLSIFPVLEAILKRLEEIRCQAGVEVMVRLLVKYPRLAKGQQGLETWPGSREFSASSESEALRGWEPSCCSRKEWTGRFSRSNQQGKVRLSQSHHGARRPNPQAGLLSEQEGLAHWCPQARRQRGTGQRSPNQSSMESQRSLAGPDDEGSQMLTFLIVFL